MKCSFTKIARFAIVRCLCGPGTILPVRKKSKMVLSHVPAQQVKEVNTPANRYVQINIQVSGGHLPQVHDMKSDSHLLE